MPASRCSPGSCAPRAPRRGVDEVWVATSTSSADDAIAAWCKANGVSVHRGPKTTCSTAIAGAAQASGAGDRRPASPADCPLLDPAVIAQTVRLRAIDRRRLCLQCRSADLAGRSRLRGGDGGGACCRGARGQAAERSRARHAVRSQQPRSLYRRDARSRRCPVLPANAGRSTRRKICRSCPPSPRRLPPDRRAVLSRGARRARPRAAAARAQSGVRCATPALPRRLPRNRSTSIARYRALAASLERAERVIPLGYADLFQEHGCNFRPARHRCSSPTATAAASTTSTATNMSISSARCCRTCSAIAIPDVDLAIRRQLTRGISFSLPTTLETELAERLVKHIPCAEMVRFGKNGTDATSAAVRLARAATRRDRLDAARLSRLAGLVHRRDDAQSRRAGGGLRAVAPCALRRSRGGRHAVEQVSRRVRRRHSGADGRHRAAARLSSGRSRISFTATARC